jgi:hypothetical protein
MSSFSNEHHACTQWVNFNGAGSFGIRDSFGVSSMDDNATGNYDINFSNTMANDDYVVAGASYARIIGMADNELYTTYARIRVIDTGGGHSDASWVTALCMGDT